MKKLIFTSLLISSCICANATVITVNNNPNSPGTFTALGAAITAAANNDTLYVHGSLPIMVQRQLFSLNLLPS